jgi:two-component system sensor histidine kinase DctS
MADVRVALARIAEQAGRAGKVIHSVHELVRRRASQRQAVAPEALLDTVLPLVQLQAQAGRACRSCAPRCRLCGASRP